MAKASLQLHNAAQTETRPLSLRVWFWNYFWTVHIQEALSVAKIFTAPTFIYITHLGFQPIGKGIGSRQSHLDLEDSTVPASTELE